MRNFFVGLLGILALSTIDHYQSARAEAPYGDAVRADPIDHAETASSPEAAEAEPMQGGSCGDGRCAPPEDCHSCAADCGSCCGDGRCMPPEDARSCPRDCS